jgi:hypothetical protein
VAIDTFSAPGCLVEQEYFILLKNHEISYCDKQSIWFADKRLGPRTANPLRTCQILIFGPRNYSESPSIKSQDFKIRKKALLDVIFVVELLSNSAAIEADDYNRTPPFSGAHECTHINFRAACAPKAFGMISRRRRSSRKSCSNRIYGADRAARRHREAQVRSACLKVTHEGGEHTLLDATATIIDEWAGEVFSCQNSSLACRYNGSQ